MRRLIREMPVGQRRTMTGLMGLLAALALIRLGPISPLMVIGNSMAPSLLPYDVRMLDRTASGGAIRARAIPARGDIVVFDQEGDRLVKRIFGLPGETVYEMWMSKGGEVFALRPEMARKILAKHGPFTRWFSINEVQLKADQYYVLADNVDGLDSRAFGPVRHSDLIGICRPVSWASVWAVAGW